MAHIHLTFSPDPAYMRTVRLVVAAVARRAGISAETVEEIRLATAEACARAVARHRAYRIRTPIEVSMTDGDRFTVRVTDHGPPEPGIGARYSRGAGVVVDDLADDDIPDDEVTADMSFVLLKGLVADLKIAHSSASAGTEVYMSWPVSRAGR
ncbi:ATP-binding protein [Luedemannella helvata]|uniref:ATP-binding protein n=1 Tax=Luedemannella helvata TaxID=349315 RepID=A0ABP4WWI5_9ACTN